VLTNLQDEDEKLSKKISDLYESVQQKMGSASLYELLVGNSIESLDWGSLTTPVQVVASF
jgi:hypothetical protein